MKNNNEFEKSEGKDVDLIISLVSLMKQLIKERSHPLDLLRELITLSGENFSISPLALRILIFSGIVLIVTKSGKNQPYFRC